jgi:hypothetical protein
MRASQEELQTGNEELQSANEELTTSRIIHLREGDIAGPISELASTLVYPQLHGDAKEVLRRLAFSERPCAACNAHAPE